MIVPILQSKVPLEDRGVSRVESPGYGPGVPEYQETIQIRPRQETGASHPWRVTSAGASSVTVSAGKVIGVRAAGSLGSVGPGYMTYVSFVEDEIAVSGAGWIYAVVSTTESEVTSAAFIGDPGSVVTYTLRPTAVSVSFSTTGPTAISGGAVKEIWIPIAQVTIDGGQAVVLDQIITHNPQINVEYVDVLA